MNAVATVTATTKATKNRRLQQRINSLEPGSTGAVLKGISAEDDVLGTHDEKWYPDPELNRDQRFRKPLLYPFELSRQGPGRLESKVEGRKSKVGREEKSKVQGPRSKVQGPRSKVQGPMSKVLVLHAMTSRTTLP